jgi:hypothetical protein
MVRECGYKKQEIYSEFFKNLFKNSLTENRDAGGRIMLRYTYLTEMGYDGGTWM